ncbi:rala-binding protein 1-like protein [Lasius niger]|uniref:Rala-binding protein 1-like protein n=1 Tax=Lasius niger TaxID=67767 RepID=A0A0J7KF88_LASNI|nr:rala-binding protein 1-like protein [Lasius niger]
MHIVPESMLITLKEHCNGANQSGGGSDPSNTTGPPSSEDAEVLLLKRECAITAVTINYLKLQREKQFWNIKRILYETNQMRREMQSWEEKHYICEHPPCLWATHSEASPLTMEAY